MLTSQNNLAAKSAPKVTSGNELPARKRNRPPRIAYIIVDGQEKGVPCTMRDFSEQGAFITLGGWIGVPETFKLYVDPHGARFNCRVISRRGSVVQVTFES
ncbi:MAG: PilZ domain-containing protein [Rhizobiaceae bacterium]